MTVPEPPGVTGAAAGAPPSRRLPANAVDALVVLLATAALYANTLGVPPYLDDFGNIDTPLTRDLGAAWAGILGSRGLSLFTFALNYRLAGLDLTWLHLTNLAIHGCAALLALACLRRVFPGDRLLAVFAALVFVAHPLQTQAVTYLVQRMTSLSALFVFASLLLFIRARESLAAGEPLWSRRHALAYGGSLLAAALALQAKPNGAVLPGLLLLFGRFFLPREGWPLRRLALYVAPFAAIPLALGGAALLARIGGGSPVIEAAETAGVFAGHEVTPLRYFATEWGVLWTYLRLLLLPLGQALLYDTPLVDSAAGVGPLLHLAGLIALLGAAAGLRRRWPTLLFGLAWLLVALSVESTFIPLEPVFEHRLYLPMFGFACAVAGALQLVPRARVRVALALAILAALGGLTIRRNALWNEPVAFLEDNLARAPGSPRLYAMLAREYSRKDRDARAIALLERSVREHGPECQVAAELASLYLDDGRLDEAAGLLLAARAETPDDPLLWGIEGRLRLKREDREGAVAALEQAARLAPNRSEIQLDLGLLHADAGRYAEAERRLRLAIRITPSSAPAHYNLGVALLAQDRPAEARDAFREAARLSPADPRPLYNAGVASLRLHDLAGAESVLPVLERLSAGDASALRSRILSARSAGAPR